MLQIQTAARDQTENKQQPQRASQSPRPPDAPQRTMPTFTPALARQPGTGFWLYGPEIFKTY
ncbi:hypothetical protein, partial [Thiohalocapsa halophila]|uniref:hypothetical protein n=1 Tax=Thiohalocapsa halophila TaxID=69359 RepID=UPI001902D03C